MNRKPRARQKKPGPKRQYDRAVLEPLKEIWLLSEQMCSKRLKGALPIWLPFYEQEHGPLEAGARQKLLKISPAAIDRLLKPGGGRVPGCPHSGNPTERWNVPLEFLLPPPLRRRGGLKHFRSGQNGFLNDEFLVEGGGEFALAADGSGELFEIGFVAAVGGKFRVSGADGPWSGGVDEVKAQGGGLERLEERDAIGSDELEAAVRESIGLESAVRHNAGGSIELEQHHVVIHEIILDAGGAAEVGDDPARAAKEADHGINEMAALLEGGSARELGPFSAAVFGQQGIHAAAGLVNLAKPAVLHRLEKSGEAGIVAPHISRLQQPIPGAGQVHQFAHFGESAGGRLLDMHMLARAQGGRRQSRKVPNGGFDHDQLAFLEQLPLLHFTRAETADRLAPFGSGIADSREIEVGVGRQGLVLAGAVRMANAEETGADGSRRPVIRRRNRRRGAERRYLHELASFHALVMAGK